MKSEALIHGEMLVLSEDETKGAAEFHNSRLPFIWINGELIFNDKYETDDRDYQHWILEDFGIQADQFERMPRGYIRPARIQFLLGSHFGKINIAEIEKDIPKIIARHVEIYGRSFEIFNGVHVGKVGDIWPPMETVDKSKYIRR